MKKSIAVIALWLAGFALLAALGIPQYIDRLIVSAFPCLGIGAR